MIDRLIRLKRSILVGSNIHDEASSHAITVVTIITAITTIDIYIDNTYCNSTVVHIITVIIIVADNADNASDSRITRWAASGSEIARIFVSLDD